MSPHASAGARVRADIVELSAALRAHLDAGRHEQAAALLRSRLADTKTLLPVSVVRSISDAE